MLSILNLESATLLIQDSTEFAALTLLALVQGLTEFLPISSSGHLVLAQSAMGLEEPALSLDVALHVGTLLAVVGVYRKDLFRLLAGLPRGELRQPLLLVVGTLPTAAVGLLFQDRIRAAFHSPSLAAGGLLGTAAILLVGEWARRRNAKRPKPQRDPVVTVAERELTYGTALFIGCAQALAILPGVSRSGSTIAMGLVLGLGGKQAARFSFLLSIPAILGAAVLSLPDALEEGIGGGALPILWAALFAGFVGWGALRVLLAFLGRGAFAWFAVYCVVLGTGALLFG